jgi:hypothetical protein
VLGKSRKEILEPFEGTKIKVAATYITTREELMVGSEMNSTHLFEDVIVRSASAPHIDHVWILDPSLDLESGQRVLMDVWVNRYTKGSGEESISLFGPRRIQLI